MMSNTYLPMVGGLENSIESFTKKLQKLGHKVKIAVPQLKGVDSHGLDIIRVPALHQLKETGFPIALPIFSELANVVDSFQPDIIHAHHPFLMGEMALRLAARYAKPLVFTYHIMFDQYAHYLPIPSSLSKRFLVELSAGFANLSTRVIAPSESVRDILYSEGVKTDIDVIPTGVDLAVFGKGSKSNRKKLKKNFGIPADAFVLGYVGRLAPEKNLEFLAKAAIGFMKRHSHVHFLMAGKGPSEEMLKKLFSESGLEKRFHFTGVLHNKALVDCYHAMDLFTFASKSETQGMVLCEAMASGTPVIGLDAPGVREVVRDFINGRLLSDENAGDFQAALSWYLNLNSQKKKSVKSAAKSTAKLFSTDVCTRRVLKTYEAALAHDFAPKVSDQTEWRRMMRRFHAEWNIMANFGRATRLALSEIVS